MQAMTSSETPRCLADVHARQRKRTAEIPQQKA
jgi:hypothetical protein